MVRIDLQLPDRADWVKVFDPRDSTLFVAMDEPPQDGDMARVDLTVGKGGPRVIFRGKVIGQGSDGRSGCSIALGAEEREKINYLNGFVRGGLLDLRQVRRLPVRLKVTYGGMTGPQESHTRDINEEGVFVVAEDPLPEDSELHLFIHVPTEKEPLSLMGVVSHTVVVEDEDVPGMGIRFKFGAGERERLKSTIDSLEDAFIRGALPEDCLL